jgi:hypothetical protein
MRNSTFGGNAAFVSLLSGRTESFNYEISRLRLRDPLRFGILRHRPDVESQRKRVCGFAGSSGGAMNPRRYLWELGEDAQDASTVLIAMVLAIGGLSIYALM